MGAGKGKCLFFDIFHLFYVFIYVKKRDKIGVTLRKQNYPWGEKLFFHKNGFSISATRGII